MATETIIGIKFDTSQVENVPARLEQLLAPALVEALGGILEAIEQAQILSYTASSNPGKLDYERTFTLRDASRKRTTRTTLPHISGEWYADEGVADYAEYVIGAEEDQAEIHQGRWKSLEDVVAEVEQEAGSIIKEAIRGRF